MLQLLERATLSLLVFPSKKEFAMLRSRILWRVASIIVVIGLVMAAFPNLTVAASNDKDKNLKNQWEAAISVYHAQESVHPKAHQMVDNWIESNKDAKSSEKNHLVGHLNVCNSSLDTAASLVYRHPGFDSSGNVIDRAVAQNSINLLRNYNSRHAGSVRAIKEHTK